MLTPEDEFDGVVGVEGVEGVEGVTGVGAGELLTQTEGCPEQLQLGWVLQLMHPDEKFNPVSQVYPPKIRPSPQVGWQTPLASGEYPLVVQVRHWVADLHVLQEPGQATQPDLLSKNCPAWQSIGLRTSCWHTPYVSL